MVFKATISFLRWLSKMTHATYIGFEQMHGVWVREMTAGGYDGERQADWLGSSLALGGALVVGWFLVATR